MGDDQKIPNCFNNHDSNVLQIKGNLTKWMLGNVHKSLSKKSMLSIILRDSQPLQNHRCLAFIIVRPIVVWLSSHNIFKRLVVPFRPSRLVIVRFRQPRRQFIQGPKSYESTVVTFGYCLGRIYTRTLRRSLIYIT